MEQNLVAAAIKDVHAYHTLKELDIQTTLSDKGLIVWELIDKWYKRDPKSTCADPAIIQNYLQRKLPEHTTAFNVFFNGLDELSSANIVADAMEQRKMAVRERLIASLSNENSPDTDNLIDEYRGLSEGAEKSVEDRIKVYNDIPTSDLVQRVSTENRIKLWPKPLYEQLGGGVLRQHHIVLFALTDIGKTLFAINLAAGFLFQNLRVLYCGNEDPGDDLLLRTRTCLARRPMDWVIQNPKEADEIVNKRNAKNLYLAELFPGTLSEIRGLIKRIKPDVIIFDQLKNLNVGSDREVERLEKAAQGIRNLCKEFNLVGVSIAQAADSANGKEVLGRGDVYGSNVGIPGSADLMIGIGANETTENMGHRKLSFPKNKVNGCKTPLAIYMDYTKMLVT